MKTLNYGFQIYGQFVFAVICAVYVSELGFENISIICYAILEPSCTHGRYINYLLLPS